MKRVSNIVNLPATVFRLLHNLRVQKSFLKKQIAPLINKHIELNDGSIGKKDLNKIYGYYGLAVPAILGEAFSVLRGTKLSENERWVLTCQGIVTGIVDDFFDDSEISDDQIKHLITKPKSAEAGNSIQQLFKVFYLKSLELSANPDENMQQAIKVMYDQFDSIEQENPEIERQRLIDITYRKGGNSMLYYRYGMNNLPDKNEIEMLFRLGSLMQLENDLFDVYKDVKSNIYTIPNSSQSVNYTYKLYVENIRKFVELSYELEKPGANINRFLDIVVPIIMRGMVCLDQYQKLSTIHNNKFEPAKYDRKSLICDMEKPVNFFATLRYLYNYQYRL